MIAIGRVPLRVYHLSTWVAITTSILGTTSLNQEKATKGEKKKSSYESRDLHGGSVVSCDINRRILSFTEP